jgi:TctA family transporter
MIGLFGLAEVIRSLGSTQPLSGSVAGAGQLELWESLRVIWRHKWLMIQSSLLGTFIGALPGAGADIAAWGAYGLAQTTSRHPDRFGQGSLEGVVAPTSANNAAVAGAWIPALAFNVPGDAVTAIVLSALMMYDIVPGPQLFSQVETIYPVFMVAIVTQFLLIPTGLIGIQTFRWLLRLPRRAVLVGVVLFSIVGSYAIRNSVFDIYVMLIFGLVGVFLESQRVPLAPLILGLILGPLLERTLRAGLIGSSGDWTPLFTRPLCLLMISMLLLSLVVLPLLRNRKATEGRALA